MRITFCGILKHSEVGENQRVGAQLRGHVHGTLPAYVAVRVSKGVNRDMQLTAMLMHEAHGFLQFLFGKVQASEVAGVGIVLQPDIHRIGTVFDSRLKRREVSGRAEQLHNSS